LLTAFVRAEVSGTLGSAPLFAGPHRISLGEPLGLLGDPVLGLRNLTSEVGELTSQLPVPPTVEGELPVQPTLRSAVISVVASRSSLWIPALRRIQRHGGKSIS
jgi:hypothetical protein